MDSMTREALQDAVADVARAMVDGGDPFGDERGTASPEYIAPTYASPDEGGMIVSWPVARAACDGDLRATDAWKVVARAPIGAGVVVALPDPVRYYDGRLYGPMMGPLRYRDGMVGTITERGTRDGGPVRVTFPDGITLALDPWHLRLAE